MEIIFEQLTIIIFPLFPSYVGIKFDYVPNFEIAKFVFTGVFKRFNAVFIPFSEIKNILSSFEKIYDFKGR